MPRTDTGNFNRFLTSLGLLLLLAAVVVPYFYFHDTDTLRISTKELHGLTEVAREALETRQRREADLEVWILVLAGLLAVSGIVAIWFGGRRLRVAQGKEDAAIDRKAKRDDVEIEQMSRSEVEEKREEQAQTALEEERGEPLADWSYRQHHDTIGRIEDRVNQILSKSVPDSYEFYPEVRTARGGQWLLLDGLYRAADRDGLDVVLELRVIRQSRSIQASTRNNSDQMLALVTRYRRLTTRRAKGWLVCVLPVDTEPPDDGDRRQLEDRLNQALIGLAKASVVHESELPTLSRRFADMFGGEDDYAK